MKSHNEFWQAAFCRAAEVLNREGFDLSGWVMHTCSANDPDAQAIVNGQGGFVDAVVGHVDPKRRVLTLFIHDVVWDEASIAAHVGKQGVCPEDSPEAHAAWWLVESLRSRIGHT
jgi:hypothetical protein